MLFAKLFGRRREEEEYEEPSAQLAPPSQARDIPPRPKPDTAGASNRPDAAGFDPYNSGAFRTTNAWERVNRR